MSLIVGPDALGRVAAMENGRVVARAPVGAALLPCPDGLIEPGAVCAHTHFYSGLARYDMPPPSPAPENFIEILERVWWRLDRALDAESLAASARDYIARALLNGTTALIDHHESPDFIEGSLTVLAEAADELGIRALLCYGASERNFGGDEGRRGLAECRRVKTSSRLRGLVGLHASFTVSDDTIGEAGALARELGTVLHVHVAEDGDDVADARRRGYAGPLQRLQALDALPAGSILAHGVHLSPAEVENAGEVWFVHNPRSNEANRVGYAASLASAKRVALGTDGFEADMAAESAALERLAAAHGDGSTAGRLAAGQRLIAERFSAAPEPLTPGALGDLVVKRNGTVAHVVVDGRIVVRDGRLTGGDFDAITAGGRTQAARLWARMG